MRKISDETPALSKRQFVRLMGGFGMGMALPVSTAVAQGEIYPSKLSTLVVGYTAGGAADTIARLLAQYFFPQYGAIVENRAGAGGMIGARYVATAAADGYTLLQGNTGEIAINKYVNPDAGFDPDIGLVAAAMLYSTPTIICVREDSPFKTLQDMIAAAKAKPGQVTFGSTGVGTQSHIAGEFLSREIGSKLNHVAYKGFPQGMADLMGGQIDSFWIAHPPAVPFLASKKIRYLALTTARRSYFVPDVPTVSEVTGISSFDFPVWGGVFAPSKTPPKIISALNSEVKRVLMLPDMQEKVKQQNFEIMERTPEQAAEFVKGESNKYRKIVAELNIKV